MFQTLKQRVQQQFALMQSSTLYRVDVNRDLIWEKYLNAFEPDVKQGNNCNCCKSFLRQYSSIVTIQNNRMVTMWDIDLDGLEKYAESVLAIKEYILSLPIDNVYLNTFDKCGTDKNLDSTKNPPIVWNHFFVKLDSKFVHKSSETLDTKLGNYRANKDVLLRTLKEISLETVDTVLELINQGSLYRGSEFKSGVEQLRTLLVKSKEAGINLEYFAWQNYNSPVSKIRNTAMGTLLVDISQGRDINESVGAFERMVAPSNYKRPAPVVSTKMIEDAKKKIFELGYGDSLERRMAQKTDLNINDILYSYTPSPFTDVFEQMKKEVKVTQNFDKVEEITITDFIQKVLPTCKKLEVYLENQHLSNMVALITGPEPSMFKWNNPFSWTYTGGVTDSMKERVKKAGGNVDGVLRYSIQWNEDGNSICDLDAFAHEPYGNHIYFSSFKGYKTPQSGMLDVDMIRPSKVGVENITWTDLNKMKEGVYKFGIHNYDNGRNTGFSAQVEFAGQIIDLSYNKPFSGRLQVAEVTYSRTNGFSIKPLIDSNSKTVSKDKWGLTSNQFHQVNTFMLSPNHWNESKGNKHYMFFLDGCTPDPTEKLRTFYNEFLKPELEVHKNFFELLGSKLSIEGQSGLAGLGFSETVRNTLIVQVTGTVKRVLKIKF